MLGGDAPQRIAGFHGDRSRAELVEGQLMRGASRGAMERGGAKGHEEQACGDEAEEALARTCGLGDL